MLQNFTLIGGTCADICVPGHIQTADIADDIYSEQIKMRYSINQFINILAARTVVKYSTAVVIKDKNNNKLERY